MSSNLNSRSQGKIFPFLKPQSYIKGETIYSRGETSHDLRFLLSGEVDVLSDSGTAYKRLTISPTEERYLLAADDDEDSTVPSEGCFGQSVLMGCRREATYIASTSVETLLISKEDIEALLAEEPLNTRRLCELVLKDYARNERIRSFAHLLQKLTKPSTGDADFERYAALEVQYHWRKCVSAAHRKQSKLYQLILDQTGSSRRLSKVLDAPATAAMENAASQRSVTEDASHGTSALADQKQVIEMLTALSSRIDSLTFGNRTSVAVPPLQVVDQKQVIEMLTALSSRVDFLTLRLGYRYVEKNDAEQTRRASRSVRGNSNAADQKQGIELFTA